MSIPITLTKKEYRLFRKCLRAGHYIACNTERLYVGALLVGKELIEAGENVSVKQIRKMKSK